MSFKKKFEETKDKAYQVFQDRPLETIAVVSVAVTAVAKLLGSVTDARNSKTWGREVSRREYNQMMKNRNK